MELSLTHAYNGRAVSPVSESLNEEEMDSNAVEVVSTADTVLEPVDTSWGVESTEPVINDEVDWDLGLEEVGEDLDVDFIQDESIVNSFFDEPNTHPSGRPKRNVTFRGRPLDNDFIYYE